MLDYHVHPDFSQDAAGSVADYCRQAAKLGLEEVCFTTHYEPDPVRTRLEAVQVRGRRRPMDSDWAKAYLADIGLARKEFPGLTVRAGVEVGYEPGLEPLVSRLLEANQFDFVLVAVHCLNHVALTASHELDRFRKEFRGCRVEDFVERYFGHVRAAVKSGLFDAVAHLDIYRKYLGAFFGPELATYAEHTVGPVLQVIGEQAMGLEVNTSALRRGSSEPYPTERIVRLAYDSGVRVFTVGSDAHRPDDLGFGLPVAGRILDRLGVEPARFERRQRIG